jgi:hypothetical protein
VAQVAARELVARLWILTRRRLGRSDSLYAEPSERPSVSTAGPREGSARYRFEPSGEIIFNHAPEVHDTDGGAELGRAAMRLGPRNPLGITLGLRMRCLVKERHALRLGW